MVETIPEMLENQAETLGNRSAIVDGAMTLSFAELAERVDEAARALIAAGILKGDRVAIWSPNSWEWIVCALAIHTVGAVLVPVNTRYKGMEAAYLLRKSGAKALFTVTGFLDVDYVALLGEAGADLPQLAQIIVLRGNAPEGTLSYDAFLELASEAPSNAAADRASEVRPDDLADILFTSGTTGKPKGAMCTHAQNLRTFDQWSSIVGLREGDRYLIVLPFFHSFGYKAGWFSALMRGATVFPEAVFDVNVVLRRIEQDAITMLPGPPALYQSMLLHPDRSRFDISSLRLAVTGAAVIPVELIHRMKDELGFDTVITAYGLTESCGVVSMCRLDDDAETIATTSGRAIPDVEVRIIDREGKAVPANQPGEIVVRGYNVMKGYFDADDETKRAIDAEGWLHTGDIGTMDERGYLKITDRLKDMFIVGGFNAYPAEIENTLLQMPGVGEAAVIGVPDERLGEVGMAFVVPAPGQALAADAVISWSRKNMANFKVPRRVEIVEALPRNATGKVVKFKLRELAHG
ncbi:MAG: FadD3 family acyl-CoA ligase [Deltaproteobacteria bacterium]|nr:FadD3 family acyl-CoA ligase [Deltaproteobacteria bacterium]NND29593.1 fatty acid--CoA ligase family protein [Myxococcales bacterium]MBT8463597.1 FadD3 family acyl-CoA ligase [Deltaproteobacteria bacterium]MBT8481378.1 FadD3 family acyl-CoA ligase [Deltaproteobacteria bacterium]NNK08682.1 fatty acid--CoA ligase family protein [Myxococcales bacterium]